MITTMFGKRYPREKSERFLPIKAYKTNFEVSFLIEQRLYLKKYNVFFKITL